MNLPITITSFFVSLEIIRHLKHYGLNTLPHVSITRALNEARQILATIKGRNYADDYNASSTGTYPDLTFILPTFSNASLLRCHRGFHKCQTLSKLLYHLSN
jgi:hypothetical protein